MCVIIKLGGGFVKKLILIAVVILLFPFVNTNVQAVEGTYASIFPDNNLASAVALEITGNSDTSQTVTQAELDTVTDLSITNSPNLASIQGIQNLPNLVKLEIADTKLADISPLASLTALQELRMPNNQIVDLTAMESLTGLVYIDLNNNDIVDVSAIDTLMGNRVPYNVYLNRNHIYDIGHIYEEGGYHGLNQTIILPSIEITDYQLSEENIVVYNSALAPVTISDGGTYNSSTNTISWNDLSNKPASVSYSFFKFDGQYTFSGIVTQPLTYVEVPTLTADKEISYTINTSKTEQSFLKDIHATTDPDATITSNFDSVVDLQTVGNYQVTLEAENTAGLKADPVKVMVHVTAPVQAPPVITADKEIHYPKGTKTTEADFLKAIHAKTNDGSIITSNFTSNVQLNKPGEYQVVLNAKNEAGEAEPVIVTVVITNPILPVEPGDKGSNSGNNSDNSSGLKSQSQSALPKTGDKQKNGVPLAGGLAIVAASLYLVIRKPN